MPNKGMTVAQFAPELLEVFRRAAMKPVTIQFNSEKQAYAFVHRMNRLRQAMRRENHFMTELAEGVTVSNWPDKTKVVIKPVDGQFMDAVKSALEGNGNEMDTLGNGNPPESSFPVSQAERRAESFGTQSATKSRHDPNVSEEAGNGRGDTGNNPGGAGKGSPETQPEEFPSEGGEGGASEKALNQFMKGKEGR